MFCYSQPGANVPFGVGTIPKSLVPIALTSSTSTNKNCNSDHCTTEPAWSHALPHSFLFFYHLPFLVIVSWSISTLYMYFFPILTLSVFNHGYHWFIFIACNMHCRLYKKHSGGKIILIAEHDFGYLQNLFLWKKWKKTCSREKTKRTRCIFCPREK